MPWVRFCFSKFSLAIGHQFQTFRWVLVWEVKTLVNIGLSVNRIVTLEQKVQVTSLSHEINDLIHDIMMTFNSKGFEWLIFYFTKIISIDLSLLNIPVLFGHLEIWDFWYYH
jgi:hypothetical protein